MIDLIQIKADVSDAINAYCCGEYCPAMRRQAVIAHAKGEACLIAVGPYSEHARDVADLVNKGSELVPFIEGLAASLDISPRSIAPEILECLVAVNDAGRTLLADVRWYYRSLARVA